ncbi:MAG: hypothetical protein QF441_05720 [Bacteriovoracaceae bacterium]|jgi:hypothetical protein|nr:hypothetical protein [Halobacteriovoraceae bacterium]MDP7320085.1 hypothetical protein [Bacteriovoracaceae bacterium]|tara:strand:- start:579 stop:1019 length:441 start_codon:yes stop_codon:yes gene_type:complete
MKIFLSYALALSFLVLSHEALADKKDFCQVKLSSEYCAMVKFDAPIGRKEDARFKFAVIDMKGHQIKLSKKPKLKLWMIMDNGHGHGSDKLKIQAKKNHYLVSNVWFLMLGQWQLKIEVKLKGKTFKKDLDICVMKPAKLSKIGKC